MSGKDWLKQTIKTHLNSKFPRKVKSKKNVPKGLKENTYYEAVTWTKHHNRYYFVIKMGNDEIMWGAESFIMEVA